MYYMKPFFHKEYIKSKQSESEVYNFTFPSCIMKHGIKIIPLAFTIFFPCILKKSFKAFTCSIVSDFEPDQFYIKLQGVDRCRLELEAAEKHANLHI